MTQQEMMDRLKAIHELAKINIKNRTTMACLEFKGELTDERIAEIANAITAEEKALAKQRTDELEQEFRRANPTTGCASLIAALCVIAAIIVALI